ncbi:MAG: mannosyltransferase family protein [Myxococcaceae bacterium]
MRALAVAAGCCAVGTLSILALGVRGVGQTTDRFARLPFLDMWIRWDAGWYTGIATDGYYFSSAQQSSVAFFPAYPLLIGALTRLGVDPFVGGIALTLFFGVVAAWLFALWAKERTDEQAASLATWGLLLWPFAFYLYGAVYSDALFLCLIVGAFLLLERGQVLPATLLGVLATATRPIAPAIVLGLLVRQLELRRRRGERLRPIDFAPLLSGLGLAAYMAFLGWKFGDPLAFLHTQAGWGQATGLEALLKLPFLRSVTGGSVLVLPLLNGALAAGMLALAIPMRRMLGWGYSVYVVTALGMPFLTSRDFIGLGRYSLAAFPAFLVLALLVRERPFARRAWLAASAVLLAVMTSKFAMGRYVS